MFHWCVSLLKKYKTCRCTCTYRRGFLSSDMSGGLSLVESCSSCVLEWTKVIPSTFILPDVLLLLSITICWCDWKKKLLLRISRISKCVQMLKISHSWGSNIYLWVESLNKNQEQTWRNFVTWYQPTSSDVSDFILSFKATEMKLEVTLTLSALWWMIHEQQVKQTGGPNIFKSLFSHIQQYI